MRCSRKSTTWLVSLALAAGAAAALEAQSAAVPGARVRAAIAECVVSRMAAVRADVQLLRYRLDQPDGSDALEARLEPGARLGRAVRVTLFSGTRPAGYAVATISVITRHVRAVANVPRRPLVESDLQVVEGDPGPVLIQKLPLVPDVLSGTITRSLRGGEVIGFTVLRPRPDVRSGERVETRATVGRLEVTGAAIALQSGTVGDTIRVVNPESRRELRGRIVGKGLVEVWHEL